MPFGWKSAKNNKENPVPQEQMSQKPSSATSQLNPPGPGYCYVVLGNQAYWVPPGHTLAPESGRRNGQNLPPPSPSNQGNGSPADWHRITPPGASATAQPRPSISSPSRNLPQPPPANTMQSSKNELLGQQVRYSEQRDREVNSLRRQLQDEKSQVEELRKELGIAREDHSSLRANLQLDDVVESGQMAEEFRSINQSIQDVCMAISSWFCRQYNFQGVDVPTTGHVARRSELHTLVPMSSNTSASSTLVQSSRGEFRPLKEFVDLTLRCQLVRRIHYRIFIPIHPDLEKSGETWETLENLYKEMRNYESQIVCGRWRSMLFNGIQSALDRQWDQQYVDTQVEQFESEVINALFEVIFTIKTNFPRNPHTLQLQELFKRCLEWNKRAKSQMYSMDYISLSLPNKGTFNPAKMQHMDLPDRQKSTTVVAAITLGLQSELARGKGWANGPKPVPVAPDCRILEKVTVITDGHFRPNR